MKQSHIFFRTNIFRYLMNIIVLNIYTIYYCYFLSINEAKNCCNWKILIELLIIKCNHNFVWIRCRECPPKDENIDDLDEDELDYGEEEEDYNDNEMILDSF